jgi:hypothetical protein
LTGSELSWSGDLSVAKPYRLIVQRDGKRVRLFTRNGHDWTKRYPWIVEVYKTGKTDLSWTARRSSSAWTASRISVRSIPAATMTGPIRRRGGASPKTKPAWFNYARADVVNREIMLISTA